MAEIEKETKIELIPLRLIKPLPWQFSVMDYETRKALLEDMRLHPDKIAPIEVRPLTPEEKEACKERYPHAEYEVIDGHKRLENAELLHWETIPAVVRSATREEATELSYRKNRERGTLDPMAEALYFKHLYIDMNMPAFKIAERFGVTERYVRQILERLKIKPEAVKKIRLEAATGKTLTGKHLTAIAKAPPEAQEKLVETVLEKKLTAKETLKVAEAIAKKPVLTAKLGELPKGKLVEEAEKIISPPPPPPKAEELRAKMLEELTVHYPPIIVDYAYTRYKGPLLKEVIKAMIFHAFWDKLTEEEREEVALKSIKEVEEKGKFEEPVIG